jgi:hypothetical protein
MDVFENTAQAVRFAFVLDQYPGDSGSIVRMALREAKIQIDMASTTPAAIRAYADQLLVTIKADLLGYERASLIAAYSRNWPERRAAADTLGSFHARLMTGLINDPVVVSKLVVRHYIAERERGASWALPAIADQYKVARERIYRAARRVDENARKLEQIALDNLAHILNDKKEPAHA